MPRTRRGGVEALNPWAGYVDALSTLLMVIIFVLLVFVLAQAFLSATLSGRTQALDALHARMTGVSGALEAERSRTASLQLSVAREADRLRAAQIERDDLDQQLGLLRAETARVTQERDRLAAQLGASDQARRADALDLGQARDQAARLLEETAALRDRVGQAGLALEAARGAAHDKDTRIAELSGKLDVALAQKVEELRSYRSEFFGKLRQVLAGQPGIQVVGDRFVFQSEVLFPTGTADLGAGGDGQIDKLAVALKDIAAKIPPDVQWILRVDGHADRQPMARGIGFDNWNLSAERAITVVRRLIADGVPPERLAAAAFGDNQPLDVADTPEAYARNRRIEIRLTDR